MDFGIGKRVNVNISRGKLIQVHKIIEWGSHEILERGRDLYACWHNTIQQSKVMSGNLLKTN